MVIYSCICVAYYLYFLYKLGYNSEKKPIRAVTYKLQQLYCTY